MLSFDKRIIRDRKGRCAFVSTAVQFENSTLRGGCILILPGQYYDQETGLHYNYFRYYDPDSGRYITSDPIGLWGGLNTYAYAELNPLKYYDRFGLASNCDACIEDCILNYYWDEEDRLDDFLDGSRCRGDSKKVGNCIVKKWSIDIGLEYFQNPKLRRNCFKDCLNGDCNGSESTCSK